MATDDVTFNYRRATDVYQKVPESQRKVIDATIRKVVKSFPEGHIGRRFLEKAMEQSSSDCIGALFVAGRLAKNHGLAVTNETMRILEDKDGHPIFYSICEDMAKEPNDGGQGIIRARAGEQLSRRAMLKRSIGFGASIVLGAEVFSNLFGDFQTTNEKGEKELNKAKVVRAATEAIVAAATFISASNDRAESEIIDLVNTVDGLVRAEIDKKRASPAR
jgi:hypothetical protein